LPLFHDAEFPRTHRLLTQRAAAAGALDPDRKAPPLCRAPNARLQSASFKELTVASCEPATRATVISINELPFS
jgi:hypothetical protein